MPEGMKIKYTHYTFNIQMKEDIISYPCYEDYNILYIPINTSI